MKDRYIFAAKQVREIENPRDRAMAAYTIIRLESKFNPRFDPKRFCKGSNVELFSTGENELRFTALGSRLSWPVQN